MGDTTGTRLHVACLHQSRLDAGTSTVGVIPGCPALIPTRYRRPAAFLCRSESEHILWRAERLRVAGSSPARFVGGARSEGRPEAKAGSLRRRDRDRVDRHDPRQPQAREGRETMATTNGNDNDSQTNRGTAVPVSDILPRRDTVNHWAMYCLDAWEASEDGDRDVGIRPDELYDRVGGEDSDVFRDADEVEKAMSALRRKKFALDCRTDPTDWDGQDVDYHYRLNDRGREALVHAGRPERLPNRREDDYDRSLDSLPGHRTGWWMTPPPYERGEWETNDNDAPEQGTLQHRVLWSVGVCEPATARDIEEDDRTPVRERRSSDLSILYKRKLLERRERPAPNISGAQSVYEYRLTDKGADVLSDLGDPTADEEWEQAG